MTGPRAFWREIKVGALRATEPPSWISANLRTPVSLAFPHIPGQDCEPGRTDTGSEHAGQGAPRG